MISFFVGKKAYDKVKREEHQYEEDEEKRSSKRSNDESSTDVEIVAESVGGTPPNQAVL